MAARQIPYKDEVIGKECLIQFQVTKTKFSFFRGKVSAFRIGIPESALDDQTERQVQHFVRFDDGDERWFDLHSEEIQGRLKWIPKDGESSQPYKDEVIGKECWIQFQVARSRLQFFHGWIRTVRIGIPEETEVDDEAEREIQHFVRFDDGDERWFNLYSEEVQGRLKWKLEEGKKVITKKNDKKVKAKKKTTKQTKMKTEKNRTVKQETMKNYARTSIPRMSPRRTLTPRVPTAPRTSTPRVSGGPRTSTPRKSASRMSTPRMSINTTSAKSTKKTGDSAKMGKSIEPKPVHSFSK